MFDIPFQHIGDGFNTAMRMPGKTAFIFFRIIIAKIIHHQERIERLSLAKPKNTMQMNPCPFHGWPGLTAEFHRTNGHNKHSFTSFPLPIWAVDEKFQYNKAEITPFLPDKKTMKNLIQRI